MTEAQQLYQRGRALYQEGRYQEAVVDLEHALALDPGAAILLYNIALVHEKLGQFDRSVEFFRRYLETDLPADERARIEGSIRRIEGARTHQPEGPGERIVHVPVRVRVVEREPAPSFGRADGFFFLTAGAGVAAVGVMAVTGALALSAENEVDRFVVGETGTLEERQEHVDRADSMATVADVALVTAGVLAVGATLLYALRRSPPESPVRASVAVGPGGVMAGVGGSF